MTISTPKPGAWSASAAQLVADTLGDQDESTFDPALRTSLEQVALLITRADALAETLAASGFVIDGSKGQPAAHPLLAEERLCRTQALQALRSLGLALGQSPASRAGAALASKRWNKPRGKRLASVSTLPSEPAADRREAIIRRIEGAGK